jgi:hypothetical protein
VNERRYLVDEMREITSLVESKLLAQLMAYDSTIQAVHYEYGHVLEILETLRQMDEAEELIYKRYPLVALITDIPERKGILGKYSEVEFTLLVVNHTLAEYKAEERRQKNFIPVIHPIVDELIIQIARSPYFLDYDPDLIKRVETDEYYLGKHGAGGGTANLANDFLDCTEVVITASLNPNCIIKPLTTNIR